MKNLLEKVRAIDKDAADYIESEVLPAYEVEPSMLEKIEKMAVSDQLSSMIIWAEMPQGWEYWNYIYKILVKGE